MYSGHFDRDGDRVWWGTVPLAVHACVFGAGFAVLLVASVVSFVRKLRQSGRAGVSAAVLVRANVAVLAATRVAFLALHPYGRLRVLSALVGWSPPAVASDLLYGLGLVAALAAFAFFVALLAAMVDVSRLKLRAPRGEGGRAAGRVGKAGGGVRCVAAVVGCGERALWRQALVATVVLFVAQAVAHALEWRSGGDHTAGRLLLASSHGLWVVFAVVFLARLACLCRAFHKALVAATGSRTPTKYPRDGLWVLSVHRMVAPPLRRALEGLVVGLVVLAACVAAVGADLATTTTAATTETATAGPTEGSDGGGGHGDGDGDGDGGGLQDTRVVALVAWAARASELLLGSCLFVLVHSGMVLGKGVFSSFHTNRSESVQFRLDRQGSIERMRERSRRLRAHHNQHHHNDNDHDHDHDGNDPGEEGNASGGEGRDGLFTPTTPAWSEMAAGFAADDACVV